MLRVYLHLSFNLYAYGIWISQGQCLGSELLGLQRLGFRTFVVELWVQILIVVVTLDSMKYVVGSHYYELHSTLDEKIRNENGLYIKGVPSYGRTLKGPQRVLSDVTYIGGSHHRLCPLKLFASLPTQFRQGHPTALPKSLSSLMSPTSIE